MKTYFNIQSGDGGTAAGPLNEGARDNAASEGCGNGSPATLEIVGLI